MQWEGGAGESVRPSCTEWEVSVCESYCQMLCSHGVGNEGLQPLSSGIGPPTLSHCGGARGPEGPRSRDTYSSFQGKKLSPSAHWPSQDECEKLSVGTGMSSRCLYAVGKGGQKIPPA